MNNNYALTNNTLNLKRSIGRNSVELFATGIQADRLGYGTLAAGSLIAGSFASKMLYESGQKSSATIVLCVGVVGAVYFAHKAANVRK